LKEIQATQEQLRHTLYAARMNLAKNALDLGGIGRAQELLVQLRPKDKETDLRHFEWHYLNRLCHGALLTIKRGATGPPSGDRIVAFSPNGMHLAGAAGERTVKVWDAQTGQELLTLPEFAGGVSGVAFSPNGKWLAVGTSGYEKDEEFGEIKVYDAETGQELRAMTGMKAVKCLAFSPDGTRLASGGSKSSYDPKLQKREDAGELKLWDAQTGKLLRDFKGRTDYFVNSMAFSSDGKLLATSFNETVVWDVQTGEDLLTIKEGGHVAFSPDGKRLASGKKVWDSQTGQELFTFFHLNWPQRQSRL
jgi:WD40 repeat protein